MVNFPERLGQLIEDSGLPASHIADLAGVSSAYLSDLRHGRRDAVSFDVAERLADALDCDPMYLDAPIRVIAPYSVALTYRAIGANGQREE